MNDKDNEFNKKNIDFNDLKKNINNVYNDVKLTSNTINFIRKYHNFPFEVMWETKGMSKKILEKIIGEKKSVKTSKALILRAKKGEKTLQILHNHTSGIPLPNPMDITIMLKNKIVNSGII